MRGRRVGGPGAEHRTPKFSKKFKINEKFKSFWQKFQFLVISMEILPFFNFRIFRENLIKNLEIGIRRGFGGRA